MTLCAANMLLESWRLHYNSRYERYCADMCVFIYIYILLWLICLSSYAFQYVEVETKWLLSLREKCSYCYEEDKIRDWSNK